MSLPQILIDECNFCEDYRDVFWESQTAREEEGDNGGICFLSTNPSLQMQVHWRRSSRGVQRRKVGSEEIIKPTEDCEASLSILSFPVYGYSA